MNKELYDIYRHLNRENRGIVLKIQQYMETRNINEISCEDILYDIAGMALEYQERGERFSDVIGNDPESFCRELIANSPRQSLVERMLHFCRWWFLFAMFLLPILYVLELVLPKYTPGRADGLIYTVRLSFPLKYYILLFILTAGWFLVRKFTYKPMKLMLTLYIAVFMLFYIFSDGLLSFVLKEFEVTVNIVVWIVILLFLTAVCDLGKRLAAITIAYRKRKSENKLKKEG